MKILYISPENTVGTLSVWKQFHESNNNSCEFITFYKTPNGFDSGLCLNLPFISTGLFYRKLRKLYYRKKYGENGEYGWHIDGSQEKIFDAKLTCLLNLSEEPYEGGDFLCFPDYNDPEKEEYKNLMGQFRIPGTIIIFHPSRPHKVLPVTKGKRITLTYWAEGPSWK